jgi:hypothetical protein
MMDAMSGDERRRARAIARPALPAGPLSELKNLLYCLYEEAGCPTLDDIVLRIREDDDLPGAPERDTVRRCIGSRTLPANQHDLVSVARVLARMAGWDESDAADRARRWWVTARTARPTGQLIDELDDPFTFEVHRAIGTDHRDGLAALPTYVGRDHDRVLNAVIDRVAANDDASAMAVLVGPSSTGKTRACWEALKRLPPGWRLWHPIDPGRQEALLDTLATIGPRTVVWLNETQLYLLTPTSGLGEAVAAGLRELLRDPGRMPALVLGTIWPEYWAALTSTPAPMDGAADLHAQARALLAGTDIPVPSSFAGVSLRSFRAAAGRDPRLAEAVRYAEGGQVTQFLAGVPALLERYRNAPAPARAAIHAAMDARRLGHGRALPVAFLAAAAPGYLNDREWDALEDD